MPAQRIDKKPRFTDWLKKSLLMVIIHSLIPLAIFVLYQNLGKREMLIKQAEKDFLTLAKISSSRLKGKINEANETLVLLDSLEVFDKLKPEYCNSATQNIASNYKAFSIIGAADTNGNIYCSNIPVTKLVNISDRLYFKESVKFLTFSSGEYQIGKITEIPGLTFGLPLLDENNKLLGVSFIAFPLDYLEELLSGITLPDEFNTTLIDKNGTVLARYPYNQDQIGKRDSDDPAITKILSGANEGSFVLKDNPSRKEKIYAYTRIDATISEGKVFMYFDVPTQFIKDQTNKIIITDILTSLAIISLVVLIVIFDWYFYIYKVIYKTVDK